MTRRRLLILVPLLVPFLALSFCAKDKRNSGSAYKSVLIEDVPHVLQKPDFCGEACAEMALRKIGKDIDQDYVFNIAEVDPSLGRGCYASDLARALRAIGFEVGEGWRDLEGGDEIQKEFKTLHEDLLRGIPSIVCMYFSGDEDATEHFRLVVGYDSKNDEIIYHEPAEEDGAYRRMSKKDFLELWPLAGGDRPIAIRLPLKGGKIDKPKSFSGFTNADYAQHVMKLKKKVPAGFTIVVQKPFVVVGDGPAASVKKYAKGVVKWTVDYLKKDYFTRDPADIIDIWLLKDGASYLKHAKDIFGDEPDTPYGYYSEEHKSLIMNISTGGGTLVHEIVHPFMASNFPGCPPWFNEGLGSLYEQCEERDGHIWGLTNWRLHGLQEAIGDGTLPAFEDLTAMDESEFYADKNGTNYAQSRYLLYYLQEKGLLVKYYHAFYKARKTDPGGFKTLKSILKEEDMEDFKKRWEKWVLTLVFK